MYNPVIFYCVENPWEYNNVISRGNGGNVMKSIKPGRGPSMMGAIVGIAIAVFGILWTIGAADMTSGMG